MVATRVMREDRVCERVIMSKVSAAWLHKLDLATKAGLGGDDWLHCQLVMGVADFWWPSAKVMVAGKKVDLFKVFLFQQ